MNTNHIHEWLTQEKGIYQCHSCKQLAIWNMAERRAFLVSEITDEMRKAITE